MRFSRPGPAGSRRPYRFSHERLQVRFSQIRVPSLFVGWSALRPGGSDCARWALISQTTTFLRSLNFCLVLFSCFGRALARDWDGLSSRKPSTGMELLRTSRRFSNDTRQGRMTGSAGGQKKVTQQRGHLEGVGAYGPILRGKHLVCLVLRRGRVPMLLLFRARQVRRIGKTKVNGTNFDQLLEAVACSFCYVTLLC